MNICVYGASSSKLEQIYYERTEALGRMMAKRGHGLVFGGGATGMMGAAARGVDAENGYILGIAPRFFDKPGVLYDTAANLFLQKPCGNGNNFWKSVQMQQLLHRVVSELMRNFLRFLP